MPDLKPCHIDLLFFRLHKIIDGFGLADLFTEFATQTSPAVQASLCLTSGSNLIQNKVNFLKPNPLLHRQRWDGYAHFLLHIEGCIHDQLVLTRQSALSEVSSFQVPLDRLSSFLSLVDSINGHFWPGHDVTTGKNPRH